MEIRITTGTYGMRIVTQTENGPIIRVKPVNMGETCEVTKEEAKRLVKLGVAEYLPKESVATPPAGKPGSGEGSNKGKVKNKPTEAENAENATGDEGGADDDGEDAPDLSGDDIVQ